MQLAAVKIKSDKPSCFLLINERDFDGSMHTLWGCDAVPSQTAEVASPASALPVEPEETQAVEPAVKPDETWDKPSLERYAMDRFGMKLDRRKSVASMLDAIWEAEQ
jgi:hypothetical protein